MAGSGARGSRHSHLPTPSISPTVDEYDISSTSTTSTSTAYDAYGAGYDNRPQSLVQWTEPGHGVNLHLAIPGTGCGPSFLSAIAPVSPIPTPTQQTFDHSHRKCGPEFVPWQDTQTLPSWPQHVPAYPPGHSPRPEDSTAQFRFNSSQLIASCFDPLSGLTYDSSGFSDQEARRLRPAKMETLRKRRNNATSESGAEERQTKARLTVKKATERPKINTQSTSAMSQTKEKKNTTVTFGPGGMLSPTSPFMSSEAYDDTEENAQDEMTYSDEEDNFETEQGAGRDTARLKHNKVERKYRNRLNSHFEQLLGVLPPVGGNAPRQPMAAPTLPSSNTLQRWQGKKAPSSRKDRERKVSKSEVLDRARVYIQSLENQHQRLIAEKKELLQMWEEYGRSVQVRPPRR